MNHEINLNTALACWTVVLFLILVACVVFVVMIRRADKLNQPTYSALPDEAQDELDDKLDYKFN